MYSLYIPQIRQQTDNNRAQTTGCNNLPDNNRAQTTGCNKLPDNNRAQTTGCNKLLIERRLHVAINYLLGQPDTQQPQTQESSTS